MTLIDFTLLDARHHDLWVEVDTTAPIPYAIRDSANHEQVIVRSHSLENLLAWAEAFIAREPDATLDENTIAIALAYAGARHSVRVPAPLRLVMPMGEAAEDDLDQRIRGAETKIQHGLKVIREAADGAP